MIWAALGTVGLASAMNYWKILRPWLLSDWTHLAVAALGALFIGSFLALYGMEKELDEMSVALIGPVEARAELRGALNYSNSVATDVLMLEVAITFINQGEKARRVYFPKVELQRREPWWLWRALPFAPLLPSTVTPVRLVIHPRGGLPGQREHWYSNKRYELPANDEYVSTFRVTGNSPLGRAAFLNRKLRLRVISQVIGQRSAVAFVPIPIVTAVVE
jgi:hypothetical protein